ncbi:flagellar hook-associated protein 1 [Oxobacter pfennigii]|uniref:Flagellar hook-associated protein 1 n=1 Tax=Oxobacter pfennigii TaxID=36849 RepID=A0A0P8WQ17_9CLOT|nr:flagellar hook-associated protein FlgK [Oxobacter pfennigii]KPU44661.1 flagellar hook-associated protein 1 [Oxobacter pfennigii]
MSGLFGTLGLLKKTVNTKQAAITTTTHNIANADTEGYTRQRVDMATSRALDLYTMSGKHYLGTGVDIRGVSRIRDMYLDVQIRDENANLGKYEARDEFMTQIEAITMEPSTETDGISSTSELLTEMWNSWQDLVNNPHNLNSKTYVVESSLSLTNEMNHIYSQLTKLQTVSKTLASQKIDTFNSNLKQIDDLTKQIVRAELTGGSPNDLLDKRDLLLDELSKMMDITVTYGQYGKITISTGEQADNHNFVIYSEARFATLEYYEADDHLDWHYEEDTDGDGVKESLIHCMEHTQKGGTIAGYYAVGNEIDNYKDRLDAMARSIAASVNLIHNVGLDASGNYVYYQPGDPEYLPVFTNGSTDPADWVEDNITAGNITINQDLLTNAEKLRAGMQLGPSYGEPFTDTADTRRALALAQLRDVKLDIENILTNVPPGTVRDYINYELDGSGNLINFGNLVSSDTASNKVTVSGFYEDLILKIGSYAEESKNMTAGENELVSQLMARRDSISGVSTDEETVNLIQFQHSLNAAFNAISVVDKLLETVINLVR